MSDFERVLREAETLLTGVFNLPVHLEVMEQFESDHTVLRCSVESNAPKKTAFQTVILKQRDLSRSADPRAFDQNLLFLNEWASLDFLATLPTPKNIAPRMYASDPRRGLVVLEDLGATLSVQDSLYQSDRQAAIQSLLGMGTTMGQMQKAAYGKESHFLHRQANLQAKSTVCDSSLDLRQKLNALQACLAGLGIPSGDKLTRAVHALEGEIHGAGPLRSFSHHDAGPHNFVITSSGVQMLDFEFAGFGFGLLDVVCARLAFPPAFRGRVLSPDLVQQVEAQYRLEMRDILPMLDEDATWQKAIAQACAHWAFSKLSGFWEHYLQERLAKGEAHDTRDGRGPERGAFFRMQVFTYLRLTVDTLDQFQLLPALRDSLHPIVDRLLGIWPETPLLPAYPAFGGEPWHYP